MTLADLGRKLKSKYPEYEHLADYEAGELLIRRFPEYRSYLSPSLQQVHDHTPTKPPLFAGHAIKRMEKEAEYNQAVINHHRATDTARRMADEEVRNLDRVTEAAELAHQNLARQLKLATSAGVDAATHNQMTLEREKVLNDIDRARQLSAVKVREDWEMHQNRLQAYSLEVKEDLNALLSMRLIGQEEIGRINHAIRELIIETESIEKLKVSEPTRQRLRAQQEKVIAAFQENLNVQMARYLPNRLLKKAAREDRQCFSMVFGAYNAMNRGPV